MKLCGQISIDLPAGDYFTLADHRRRLEDILNYIRDTYPDATLAVRERPHERHEDDEDEGPPDRSADDHTEDPTDAVAEGDQTVAPRRAPSRDRSPEQLRPRLSQWCGAATAFWRR